MPKTHSRHWLIVFVLLPSICLAKHPCDSVSDPQQRQKCYAQSQRQPPQVQQPQQPPPQGQPSQRQPQVQQPQQPPPQGQQQHKTLTPMEAQQRIQDLNRNRTAMPGINRNPLPPGQVTVHPDGTHVIAASGGRQVDVRPNGTVAKVVLGDGRAATFRPDGKVSSVHTGEMQIHYTLHGERHIVAERQDKSVVVSTGANRGYVQRPLVVHHHTYVQRTYVVNNVIYTRVYRPYVYRGVAYDHYVPVAYYQPGFYSWVFRPWPAPVVYTWGWYREPWYGYYAPYFAAYPVYPTAALWLTDFILAENLKLAYQAQAEAHAAVALAQANASAVPPTDGGHRSATPLTPEIKQTIAEEVRRQLAAERHAAAAIKAQQPAPRSADVPAALDPKNRVFVVSSPLDTRAANGQECSLTPGDIITRLTDTPDTHHNVTVSVLSSTQMDCAPGAQVTVAVQDLQEMHNRFREHIEAGLQTLADNGGTGGLPTAPDTRTQRGEVPPLAPDTNIVTMLQNQQQQADQAEQAIQQWR